MPTKKELALIFALLFIIVCILNTYYDVYKKVWKTMRSHYRTSLQDGLYVTDDYIYAVVYTTLESTGTDKDIKCRYVTFIDTKDNTEEKYLLVPIDDGTYYTKDGVYLLLPKEGNKIEVVFNTDDTNYTSVSKFQRMYNEVNK